MYLSNRPSRLKFQPHLRSKHAVFSAGQWPMIWRSNFFPSPSFPSSFTTPAPEAEIVALRLQYRPTLKLQIMVAVMVGRFVSVSTHRSRWDIIWLTKTRRMGIFYLPYNCLVSIQDKKLNFYITRRKKGVTVEVFNVFVFRNVFILIVKFTPMTTLNWKNMFE